MIHDAPIVSVEISYTNDMISSVRVKFVDQIEATYEVVADIDEVFARIAEQQRRVEQGQSAHGVETQGTSA
jgi:hypothetical protein